MYPGTYVEFDDQSEITALPITDVRNRPLFGAVFTSDKGTEAWTRISGKDFFDMYGKTISFTKHGQPLLQAAISINAGAELLCKRLVADDATLANIAIYAKLTTTETEVQKTDAAGAPLYEDEAGEQTTEVTDKPIMETKKSTTISYSKKSVKNINLNPYTGKPATIKDVVDNVDAAGKGEYLLYVISDIGRGTSKKRIRIVPNYKLSKGMEYTSYNFSVLEGSVETESLTFSANPNLIVNNQNISLMNMINTYSSQISCYENVDSLNALIEAVANATGLDTTEIVKHDILFGCTNKGVAIDGITVDTTGLALDYTSGQALENGSDGALANPATYLEESFVATDDAPNVWADLAVAAFDGSFDKVIFNIDQFKIHAIVDANYPAAVKKQIAILAAFREDLMYFRDFGRNLVSYDMIKDAVNAMELKSMFIGDYPIAYDVIDPYTKRQISVTAGYTLARKLVAHIDNGAIFPVAGMKYDMVIDDAVYGTLRFTPTICPDGEHGENGNEKELMEDIKANFATYIDNQLVIETLYTSQEKNSQWSYVNNVMGIQEVVKAIRTKCPTIRYTFIEGEDLEKYKADVEEVLERYSSNYLQLSLEYKSDSTYAANKIFYAVLKVVYKNFVQSEWFKVTALSTVEVQQS